MVGKIPNMDEMKKLPLSSVIILKSQIHVLPLALCNASYLGLLGMAVSFHRLKPVVG